MTDYEEQRHKVGTVALKIFRDYGPDRALQMYFGAIDALVYAALAVNQNHGVKLAFDNTKPVELPCDVGPAA